MNKNTKSGLQAKFHRLSSEGSDLPYLPMHSHDFYEINILTQGKAMHYINDNIYLAPTGSVFVLPPNIQHGYFSEEDTEIFHLIISSSFISLYTSLLNDLKGFSFLFDVEPILRRKNQVDLFLKLTTSELKYIQPILDRLCLYEQNFQSNKKLTTEFLVLNLIAELCNFSYQKIYTHEENPDKTNKIIKIMEYISANCREKINFHKVAENNNMSYATFFRHFKKICCMTPIEYLTNCRMSEAINMMEQKKYTLTDIALSCGFYDAAHFTKTFISKKGCPPTDFLFAFIEQEE